MPNTVYEKDERYEKDKRYEKNERYKKDEWYEKDERYVEDEKDKEKKIKKLHTTPNPFVFRRGSGRWRAEREQQTSATLAEYLLLYTHEIQL